MTADTLLFLFNAGAAVFIAYVCICRLNELTRQSLRRVRLKYTLLCSGSLTIAGLPVLFGMHHNLLTLGAVVLVLVLLMLEYRHWRHGPPPHTFGRFHE